MEAIKFNKIMVATDYTELSQNAVRTAAHLCRSENAKLILLHVVESAALDAPPESHQLHLDYSTELKNASQIQIRKLAGEIRGTYGIIVEEFLAYGLVVTEIIQAINAHSPDLVILGTHGTSGFRRFFMGSTAYRVIKHTRFPVLTIPGEGDWTRFDSILFPVRLVPSALYCYTFIRPIIQKFHAVVHVLGLTMEKTTDNMDEVFQLEEQLSQRMKEDRVGFDVVNDHCDNYATRILAAADHKKANLIVVTAMLDLTFREFFIGPSSQQILNHAKVPVLTLRLLQ